MPESGFLYRTVTRYWPRIAVGLVVLAGLTEWLAQGLTADSGIEFYLMAWAATTGGLWFLFDKAETALGAESRASVGGWLSQHDVGHSLSSIPKQFAILFDRVFGERHWSWGCLTRSCVASSASITFLVVLAAAAPTESLPLAAGLEVTVNKTAFWAETVFTFMLLNFVPDYLSLLETRWAISLIGRSGKLIRTLLIDAAATATIAFLLPWAAIAAAQVAGLPVYFVPGAQSVSEVIVSLLKALVLGDPSVVQGGMTTLAIIRISFLSAFFTSVWLWLYAASVLVSRVLVRMGGGVGFLLRVTDVEKQPFRSMGFTAVVLTSLLFLVGLPWVVL